jgi:hypothetical protein
MSSRAKAWLFPLPTRSPRSPWHGVQRDRLTGDVSGEQRPMAPNTLADGTDNPAGRALNGRVEALVQAMGGVTR